MQGVVKHVGAWWKDGRSLENVFDDADMIGLLIIIIVVVSISINVFISFLLYMTSVSNKVCRT
jgi:hypothetical protein